MVDKRKVLVVEDDPDLASLLCFDLQKNGYVCEDVRTLEQAKFKLRSERFNFLLLDLRLPDGNGLEILPYLFKTQNSNVSIIVSSGNVSLEAKKNTRINKIFEKPYLMKDLLNFMETENGSFADASGRSS